MSDADFRAVCERADDEGLTRSEYLRYVVRMVADDPENAKRGGVLLDGLSMRKLSRELVKWGHHYNQGVHALNSIKFALDHGRGDLEGVVRQARRWRAAARTGRGRARRALPEDLGARAARDSRGRLTMPLLKPIAGTPGAPG